MINKLRVRKRVTKSRKGKVKGGNRGSNPKKSIGNGASERHPSLHAGLGGHLHRRTQRKRLQIIETEADEDPRTARDEISDGSAESDSEYDDSFIDDSNHEDMENDAIGTDTPTSCAQVNCGEHDGDSSPTFERDVLDSSSDETPVDGGREDRESGTPQSNENGDVDAGGLSGSTDPLDTVDICDPFSAARDAQNKMLSKRREQRNTVNLSVNPHITSRDSNVSNRCGSISDQWNIYVSNLFEFEPDFLTSPEAKMVIATSLRKGITSYRRIIINEKNCEDIQEVYRLMFKAKVSQGFSNAGYSHFLTAVGQFVRMRCALEADEIEREMMVVELCNERNLFRLVASLDHVELFLDYFEARSSSSATCLGKSAQILKLATSARRFYERKGDTLMVAQIETVMDKLHSTHSAYKQATRRQSRERKSIEMRKEKNILMLPNDFMQCRKTAVNKLTALMSTIRRIKVQQSREESERRLLRDESLMSMWSINLLAVMMICCGGQRPQVFCQLTRPSPAEFRRFQTQANDKSYIELRTMWEKTTRALDMPFVPFPASLMSILKLHVSDILPVLDKKRANLPHVNGNENRIAGNCLLLHSKRGLRLATKQVTDTFRLFLFHVNPKLSDMTSMNLRSSYATMMLHAHRNGKILKNNTEEQFLEFLAKAMNTSVEQLRDTYACVMNQDYNSIANAISDSLHKIVDQDDSEQEEVPFTQCANDAENENPPSVEYDGFF